MTWQEELEKQRRRQGEKVIVLTAEQRAQKLDALQHACRCGLCGKRPTMPATREIGRGHTVENWEEPGDLYRCVECGPWYWYCAEHYYFPENLCQEHAMPPYREGEDKTQQRKLIHPLK